MLLYLNIEEITMIHVVFVHGVSVREDDNYKKEVEKRHDFFKKYCFNSTKVEFYDPYWGKYGYPHQTLRSIPQDTGTTLALGGEAKSITKVAQPDDIILQTAREDFPALLNTFSILLAQNGSHQNLELADNIAAYVAGLENEEGEFRTPNWLTDSGLKTDSAFFARLNEEIQPVPTEKFLGLGDALQSIGDAIGKFFASGLNVFEGLARKVTPKLAHFLGDVFVYLKSHENEELNKREAIRETVLEDLKKAAKAAQGENDKLIVIGHSMGANILYDMLTDTDYMQEVNKALCFKLKIDLFLTVGTQLGLFEELDLFTASTTEGLAPSPASVTHWWHVYNRMDVLSFTAEGIFADVKEFSVNTKANIIDAHTAYFSSPVFFKRLQKRLKKVNLI